MVWGVPLMHAVWLGASLTLALVAHWRGISTRVEQEVTDPKACGEFRCIMGFFGVLATISFAQLLRLL